MRTAACPCPSATRALPTEAVSRAKKTAAISALTHQSTSPMRGQVAAQARSGKPGRISGRLGNSRRTEASTALPHGRYRRVRPGGGAGDPAARRGGADARADEGTRSRHRFARRPPTTDDGGHEHHHPRLQQLPPQPGPDRRRGGAGPRAGTARFLSRCPSPDPRSCKSFVRTAKLSKITAKLGRLNASMH